MGLPSFFETAFEQGTVPSNIFSIKLASTGSSLFLGGTDDSLFTGSVEYHSLVSERQWKIGGANLAVGGTTALSGANAIFDTGARLIHISPAEARTLCSNVPGSQLFDSANGYYSAPCNSLPNISITFGGLNWDISQANINLGETTLGSGKCVLAIAGSAPSDSWILGTAFIKNAYVVFSKERNAVGLATLA